MTARTVRFVLTVPLLAALCAASGSVGLESPTYAGEKPARPPELKLLDQFAGNWDTQFHTKVAEWSKKEIRVTGKTTNAWVLGDRFMECRGTDTLPSQFVGKFTYDIYKKQFRFWHFDSQGHAGESSGQWDADARTFVLKADMGNDVTSTLTARFVDKSTIEWRYGARGKDGKVYLDMEGKWTRRK